MARAIWVGQVAGCDMEASRARHSASRWPPPRANVQASRARRAGRRWRCARCRPASRGRRPSRPAPRGCAARCARRAPATRCRRTSPGPRPAAAGARATSARTRLEPALRIGEAGRAASRAGSGCSAREMSSRLGPRTTRRPTRGGCRWRRRCDPTAAARREGAARRDRSTGRRPCTRRRRPSLAVHAARRARPRPFSSRCRLRTPSSVAARSLARSPTCVGAGVVDDRDRPRHREALGEVSVQRARSRRRGCAPRRVPARRSPPAGGVDDGFHRRTSRRPGSCSTQGRSVRGWRTCLHDRPAGCVWHSDNLRVRWVSVGEGQMGTGSVRAEAEHRLRGRASSTPGRRPSSGS